MKKPRQAKGDPDMRTEYDFRGGVRGKYARRFGGRVGVILDPDVSEVFEDSETVNAVLRAVAELVRADRRRRTRKTATRRAG